MASFQNEEEFELPVLFKGSGLMLPAKFAQMGYTYKIFVSIGEQEIIFEPDEERNLRAIIEHDNFKNVAVDLVRAIGESLNHHFNL